MEAFLAAFKQKPGGSTARRSKTSVHIPWVEKYRPKRIDEIAHQTEVVSVLKKCLDGADLPNLLFYGPPGTGKTSLITALARQLFGSLYSERVLELNASDERGIDVIRQKVKTFAHLAVSSSNVRGGPPPYKLIILDEADSMTAPAQAALRRTMETETRTTRFCLTCNYVTRIIDPITSRCAKFRFRPLDNAAALARLRHVSDGEGLKITDECLNHLLQLSGGDLRRAITMLQSVWQLTRSAAGAAEIAVSKSQLDEVAAVIPPDRVSTLIEAAQKGRFDELQTTIKDVLLEGHSAQQAISQLHAFVIESETLTDQQKAALLEAIAKTIANQLSPIQRPSTVFQLMARTTKKLTSGPALSYVTSIDPCPSYIHLEMRCDKTCSQILSRCITGCYMDQPLYAIDRLPSFKGFLSTC